VLKLLVMKRSTLLMLIALAPLAVQPACALEDARAPIADDESTDSSSSALLGGSKLLWPMQDGKATVRVCWLPLDMGGETMPGGPFAVDPTKVIAERRQWVREGVEREWNGRTVMSFVGWEDCGSQEVDVRIQPIASQGIAHCPDPAPGASCVEKIGSPVRGKRVFITMLFGDEALGEARYLQTVTQKTLDKTRLLPNGIFAPAICGPQLFAYDTHFSNKQPVTNADIDAIGAVYKDCLQNQSNHEFGHLAGFSHEQNRKDVSSACAKQYAASTPDDPSDEDSPLGTFEEDSIMSYCRTTVAPTLTAQDVAQTNEFYTKLAPKLPSAKPAPQSESTPDPITEEPAADEPATPPTTTKKKKSGSALRPSTGGCNGN
jgi:hypothetical protein